MAIDQSAGREHIVKACDYFERQVFLLHLFPETAFNATGTGDSNLNKGHMALLHRQLIEAVALVKGELIGQQIRPLIEFNFGPQDDYGEFPEPETVPDERIQLLEAIGNGIQKGSFGEKDLEVINAARKLIGVELLTELPEPPVTVPAPAAPPTESNDSDQQDQDEPPVENT